MRASGDAACDTSAAVPLHSAHILVSSLRADHMVSPEEVADRYSVAVDWKNIGGSKGLTSQQVRIALRNQLHK
jgi:hypothetical protein